MKIVRFVLLVSVGMYLLVVGFLFFAQESFLFQPQTLNQDYQYDFDTNFEELFLEMKDGAVLNALHFKQDSAKGVILYFHGNAGNLRRWGEIVQYFTTLHYDVIVMDYRQYGKSKGAWSFEAFLSDADEFYKYTLTHYDEEDIIVYGRSLGTGIASWVASRNKPKSLILESPYTSVVEMGEFYYPLAPSKWLIRYNFNPLDYLRSTDIPVYIFHGTNDLIVPFKLGQRLYDELKPSLEIELITIKKGGHNDLIKSKIFTDNMEKVLSN